MLVYNRFLKIKVRGQREQRGGGALWGEVRREEGRSGSLRKKGGTEGRRGTRNNAGEQSLFSSNR